MLFALLFLTAPLSLLNPQAPVAIAATLTPEEIAFAARLADANRRAFVSKLNVEQRAHVMALAKISPDKADELVASLIR